MGKGLIFWLLLMLIVTIAGMREYRTVRILVGAATRSPQDLSKEEVNAIIQNPELHKVLRSYLGSTDPRLLDHIEK